MLSSGLFNFDNHPHMVTLDINCFLLPRPREYPTFSLLDFDSEPVRYESTVFVTSITKYLKTIPLGCPLETITLRLIHARSLLSRCIHDCFQSTKEGAEWGELDEVICCRDDLTSLKEVRIIPIYDPEKPQVQECLDGLTRNVEIWLKGMRRRGLLRLENPR